MTATSHINPGNIMLRWISEQEEGTWTQFRQTAASCLAVATQTGKASVLANRLSDLGHLDIEWGVGRWSVAPPVLVVPRGMGMCTYLAGWRTSWLEARFEEAMDEPDIYLLDGVEQPNAPTARFAKCGSIAAIEGLAEALHVRVVWDPSAQLADLVKLPALSELEPAAPPTMEDEVEMFDQASGSFDRVTSAQTEGLYQYELHGRPAFRLLLDGDWRIVDRATGLLHVLRGQPLMRWHRTSSDLRTGRSLTVPVWLTLPSLAERSLVAATGMLPVMQGDRRIYRNVTRDVGQRIADALSLSLEIANAPLRIDHGGAS